MKTINTTANILCLGKKGSGKSWVVRAILHHYAKTIPVGIVIAPTDRMNKFYSNFMNSKEVDNYISNKEMRSMFIEDKIYENKTKKFEPYEKYKTILLSPIDNICIDTGKLLLLKDTFSEHL